ncbi:MAG TPA: CCA tRNA nucleotidyltransferase [Candidatus Peribacterales bacterium]|nr:CCA tRNA nucleotidyltransferase [Candidatus Peribacterales bacterium]
MPINKNIIDQTFDTPYGKQAYHLVEGLTDAGYDAWWVGGGVRDMFMGKIPKDIDIGTNAKPPEVKNIFPKHNDESAALGSMRVTLGGETFEVTTFREDDEASDGRHPESIRFSTKEKDALRRDITINALYYHPISRELFDPTGGEGDLKERLVRIIGDPDNRIKHDALRLLRVIRFRALIEGQYHPETYQALHRNAAMIKILSGERLMSEFEKMLLGPSPARALEDLWETDILEHMIPELHACKGVAQPADYHREGDVWEHILRVARAFTEDHSLDVRIGAIFHDCGKAKTFARKERIRFDEHASISADLTKDVLDRLKVPSRRREKICWLIRHHMMMGSFYDPIGKQEIAEESKARWYYHPYFPELLQLFWLDVAGTDPSDFSFCNKIEKDYHRFLDSHPRPPKVLLTGEEVMELLGIGPGEKVGEILKKLYEKQIKKEVTTKEEAREFAKLLAESGEL